MERNRYKTTEENRLEWQLKRAGKAKTSTRDPTELSRMQMSRYGGTEEDLFASKRGRDRKADTSRSDAVEADKWTYRDDDLYSSGDDPTSLSYSSHSSIYRPLPTMSHIRLVILHPGKHELCATLEEVDLAEAPEYEALSYAWGNPRFIDKYIVIDGYEFPIRDNLWTALRRMRYKRRERALWVDALSICQDDPEEKAEQVSMIGDIFRQARRVLVWVGERERHSNRLFVPPSPKAVAADPQSNETRANVWAEFLRRDYWSRRWIIQELILASHITVYCGADSMSWRTLIEERHHPPVAHAETPRGPGGERFLGYIDKVGFFEQTTAHSLFFRIVEMRKARVRAVPLLELMMIFRESKCSDDLDKVYAFLTLDSQRLDIQPDYSIKFEQLFIQTLFAYFGQVEPVKGFTKKRQCEEDQIRKIAELHHSFGMSQAQIKAVDNILMQNDGSARSLVGPRFLSELGRQILNSHHHAAKLAVRKPIFKSAINRLVGRRLS